MAKAKKLFLLRERRETHRVRIDRERRAFCEKCGHETLWLTAAEAATFSGLREREIFRLAENAEIHFRESELGRMLVCDLSVHGMEV